MYLAGGAQGGLVGPGTLQNDILKEYIARLVHLPCRVPTVVGDDYDDLARGTPRFNPFRTAITSQAG
jgi:hypothetical protein